MHGVEARPSAGGGFLAKASDWLGAVIAAVAALLVVAAIVVLLAGVGAR